MLPTLGKKKTALSASGIARACLVGELTRRVVVFSVGFTFETRPQGYHQQKLTSTYGGDRLLL